MYVQRHPVAPPQVGVVPAQIPLALQKFAGGVSPSSVRPSQSSSAPLQTSAPRASHAYSQPLPAIPSRSTKPLRQLTREHVPPLQRVTAFG